VRKTPVRPHLRRILVAGFAALVLSVGLLEYPAHSPGSSAASQPSSKVAVVPGFAPQPYSGNAGVPPLPVSAPQLSKYHFVQLPAGSVTSAALSGYDTVLLYGIRWSDISSGGQAAINTFAATHKVVIWDSDATGAQAYSTFIHPFSTLSSGQSFKGKPNDSVVSFPTGVDFLASDNPASPYYLDPNELIDPADRDEINDMNAMTTGTKDWVPALIAANTTIPNGGWPLAWSYGVIGNHTGMTIYSGIDADAFAAKEQPNNAVKELALDLAAPFRSTPDSSCSSNCGLPSSGGSNPFAACSFAKRVPGRWVHGRVTVVLKTSVAAGITGQIVERSGRVVASGTENSGNLVRFAVRTKKLPSNRISRLRALVLYNGKQACSKGFRLKVDNVRPRLLRLATARGGVDLLTLRISERSRLKIVGRHVHWHTRLIAARRTMTFHLPASVRRARLILRDRAGNTVVRKLVWR
jgi:hypothetical protein